MASNTHNPDNLTFDIRKNNIRYADDEFYMNLSEVEEKVDISLLFNNRPINLHNKETDVIIEFMCLDRLIDYEKKESTWMYHGYNHNNGRNILFQIKNDKNG